MRIIHLNCDAGYSGGATIAAIRIFNEIKKIDNETQFVSRFGYKADIDTVAFSKHKAHQYYFKKKRQVANGCMKLLCGKALPINIVNSGIASFINSLKPDVVHLHWVKADTISIEEIDRIEAPIVWSLHDLWPCLGTDSYPQNNWYKEGYHGCSGVAAWLDSWTWRRKLRAFKGKPIYPVGPSEWASQVAQESIIFQDHNVSCIPYPLDLNCFVPEVQAEARAKWGLEPKRYIVLFGANMGTQWSIKGFDRLVNALPYIDEQVKREMQIAVFGESAPPRTIHSVPVIFLGKTTSSDAMAKLYPVADLFAFPSRQETFGQTKIEALACGVPVAAFNETACAEGIIHGKTGWVAESDDYESFAQGLIWGWELKNNSKLRRESAILARESVKKRHDPGRVGASFYQLYQKIVEK